MDIRAKIAEIEAHSDSCTPGGTNTQVPINVVKDIIVLLRRAEADLGDQLRSQAILGARLPKDWRAEKAMQCSRVTIRLDSPKDAHSILIRSGSAPDHHPSNLLYDLCAAILKEQNQW